MLTKEEGNLKCVHLKGELSDWGNHVLLPYLVTLCGMPVVGVDTEQFPALKDERMKDMINEYEVVEWDITCKKCLEVTDIMVKANQSRKARGN